MTIPAGAPCSHCGLRHGVSYCRLVEHPEVAMPDSVASMVSGATPGGPETAKLKRVGEEWLCERCRKVFVVRTERPAPSCQPELFDAAVPEELP